MIKTIMNILSGKKMTLLSAGFLFLSLFGMFYNINFLINPAWGTVLISGLPIAYIAFNRLFVSLCISAPLLITTAMIASISVGELFAAGEIALIMAIGELLEDFTIDRAKRGLSRLLELTPTTARKIFNNGDEKILDLNEIKEGDILRVLPGETIAADGIIVKGSSSLNQAALTGESVPVDKTIGDKVMAGTINCFGVLEIKVEAVSDTCLQRMINLVKEAQAKKAPTQRIVDKWASILVPAALGLAVLTYFITGEVIRAVTVLVVFCPCALVLATPTSIMAAIGQAAKHGVLIKSGAALEEMGKIDTIAFDKTGTLSMGDIQVSDIIPVAGTTKDEVLSLAAGLEKYSEHTLASAIVREAKRNNVAFHKIEQFSMFPGKGVTGIFNKEKAMAGNVFFCQENDVIIDSSVMKKIRDLQNMGKALVVIALKDKVYGIIGLSDVLRKESRDTVCNLENIGVDTLILTGDNQAAAGYFARLVGISKVYADLLPEDKVLLIKDLIKNGHRVGMVGDGINDAAALKTAHVGIAMGHAGSDYSIDAADIALINDHIDCIYYLKKLSLITIKTIKINISISMVLNFLGIMFSMLGILTPMTGAVMHNLGSVIVVLNAARLYDKKL